MNVYVQLLNLRAILKYALKKLDIPLCVILYTPEYVLDLFTLFILLLNNPQKPYLLSTWHLKRRFNCHSCMRKTFTHHNIHQPEHTTTLIRFKNAFSHLCTNTEQEAQIGNSQFNKLEYIKSNLYFCLCLFCYN